MRTTKSFLFLCMCLSFMLPMAGVATEIFFDDFTGSSVDPLYWHIPTWVSPTDGTYVGQTQFRCTQNAGLPICTNSSATIVVETYNPTGYSFYGTDLISNFLLYLPSTNELVVTAVLKANQVQPGTVFAFFLYNAQTNSTGHDEIDFELVGNLPDEFNTNIYGDEPLGVGHPQYIAYPSGGSITNDHTYTIHWSATQVVWAVDGVVVRTVTNQSPIPQGPMHIHFNAWVPDDTWPQAYSSTVSPSSSAASDQIWSMSVDSVAVTWDGTQIPTFITVEPSPLTIAYGTTDTLVPNCLDQNSNLIVRATFTFASGNPSIATVNDAGVVTPVAAGTTDVTVAYSSVTNTVVVTVPPIEPSIQITSVAPLGSAGYVSGTVDTNAPNWQDYNVAVLIDVAGGWWTKPYFDAPLTAINTDGTWSCYFTTGGDDADATEVRAYLIPFGVTPSSASGGGIPSDYDQYTYASITRTYATLSVSPTTLNLSVGATGTVVGACLEGGVAIQGVWLEWSSDNPFVATVSGILETGTVTAVSPGTANIIAAYGSQASTTLVTVSASYPAISITKVAPFGTEGSVSGTVGSGWQNYDVAVLINVAGGWWTKPYFSDPLTTIGTGGRWSCYFTTGGNDADATEVRVYLIPTGITPPSAGGGAIPSGYSQYPYASVTRPYPPIKSIKVSKRSLKMFAGDTYTETARVMAAHGVVIPETLNWSSANPAVATVDQTGDIQAVAPGATTVTVATTGSGAKHAVIHVRVKRD